MPKKYSDETMAYIRKVKAEHDKLDALPPGRYYDGTYEWDYEGNGEWEPLHAPYGMSSHPDISTGLRRVITAYEDVVFGDEPVDPQAPATVEVISGYRGTCSACDGSFRGGLIDSSRKKAQEKVDAHNNIVHRGL